MEPSEEITLVDLWRIIRAEFWTLVGITASFALLSVVYAFVATEHYSGTTVIVDAQQRSPRSSQSAALLGQLGGIANLAGINLGGETGGSGQNGRNLLMSRTFIEHFIETNQLMPTLLPDLWDPDRNDWATDAEVPPVWEVAEDFRERITLETDLETGLITFSVEWTDPVLAADWTNEMIRMANEEARRRDIADANRSITYLNEQIERTNVVELQNMLYRLLESEHQTLMLANAREEYVFQVMDRAEVPDNRSAPHRRLIVIFGTMFGGFFALLFVFLRRLARTVRELDAGRGSLDQ